MGGLPKQITHEEVSGSAEGWGAKGGGCFRDCYCCDDVAISVVHPLVCEVQQSQLDILEERWWSMAFTFFSLLIFFTRSW